MNINSSSAGIKAKFPSLSKWFTEISEKPSLREVVAQYASLADMKSILSGKSDGELLMVEFHTRVCVCVHACVSLSEASAMLECNGDTIGEWGHGAFGSRETKCQEKLAARSKRCSKAETKGSSNVCQTHTLAITHDLELDNSKHLHLDFQSMEKGTFWSRALYRTSTTSPTWETSLAVSWVQTYLQGKQLVCGRSFELVFLQIMSTGSADWWITTRCTFVEPTSMEQLLKPKPSKKESRHRKSAPSISSFRRKCTNGSTLILTSSDAQAPMSKPSECLCHAESNYRIAGHFRMDLIFVDEPNDEN